MKTNLFISHAWSYSKDYYNLVDLLANAPNFEWSNFSVPKHDPIIDPGTPAGIKVLTNELDEQIRHCHCFLIISGMYVHHKFWIQREIDIARKYKKPIIGLIPRGQERTPQEVTSVANEMVHWNTSSIVSAIRKYHRERFFWE